MKNQSTLVRSRASRFALLGACLFLACSSGTVKAAEGTWSGSSELTVVSDYLWRGFKLGEASIQPSLTGVYSDKFTLGVWGTYAVEEGDSGRYNETDLLGSYTFSQDAYSLTVGGTLYQADNLVDPNTGAEFDAYFESFVSLTFKHAWSPTVTFWREYGRLSTNYVEFSVSPSVSLNEKTRLSFRPYVGFFENSNDYYGADIALNHDFDKGFYGRASVTLIKSSFGGERASFGVSTGYRW